MPQTFRLSVNGDMREVSVEADTPLLYILRNDLELNGAKFGCGLAQCGACTVIMDGAAIRSCHARFFEDTRLSAALIMCSGFQLSPRGSTPCGHNWCNSGLSRLSKSVK